MSDEMGEGTGEPADRDTLHVYDLARTAGDPFTAHLHSPTAHGLPDPVVAALQAAAQAMAAQFTAQREEACRQALADGTQGVLADSTTARMDPRVPAGQFWQLPVTATLADVDEGWLDGHLDFLREQVTRPMLVRVDVVQEPRPVGETEGGQG